MKKTGIEWTASTANCMAWLSNLKEKSAADEKLLDARAMYWVTKRDQSRQQCQIWLTGKS